MMATAAQAQTFGGVPQISGPAPTLNNSSDKGLALTPSFPVSGQAPAGSKPPNPDPRELDGVWYIDTYHYMLGPDTYTPGPLKPEFLAVLERRIRAKNAGSPEPDASTQCLPHGMPRVMESPYPIEIVQTPGQITFLHEVAHNVRRIYLDRPPTQSQPASWMGYSEGHWDGGALVVTTTHLNDRTFLDDEGEPKSTKLRITERIRKIDGGRTLEVVTTIDDPVVMEHPYDYRRIYHWRPDVRPQEYVCEENNRNAPRDGVTAAGTER